MTEPPPAPPRLSCTVVGPDDLARLTDADVDMLVSGWHEIACLDPRLHDLYAADAADGANASLGAALRRADRCSVRAALGEAITSGRFFLVKGELDGRVVAVATVSVGTTARSTTAFLHLAAVAPGARRAGLLRRLFEEVCAESRRRGATVLWAECMAGNVPAMRAWERLGLELVYHTLRLRL
jgi:GNAT superfamily N-acetyltransferase